MPTLCQRLQRTFREASTARMRPDSSLSTETDYTKLQELKERKAAFEAAFERFDDAAYQEKLRARDSLARKSGAAYVGPFGKEGIARALIASNDDPQNKQMRRSIPSKSISKTMSSSVRTIPAPSPRFTIAMATLSSLKINSISDPNYRFLIRKMTLPSASAIL